MKETPDEELTPLAEAVCDGRAVDWESETAQRPDMGPVVREFRVLESLAAVYRDPRAPEEGAEPPPDGTEPPAQPIGRWGLLLLIEKIGQGGFGEVYRAYDPGLQREVALKLLRPERFHAEDSGERVLEEGRRLARVRHPNVVVVHGVDRHEGAIGIWSDLVRGQTLEALLAQQGPLGAREASHVGIELCRALAAVHAVGLVHRDVKTSNVMREQGGRIVLMDFGAASEAVRQDDPSAHGTPLATAPEIFRGEAAGPAADLYALGVLLYRVTSGHYPIEAADLEDLRARHASDARVPLRDRRPDLPAGFVRIVETALEADPRKRFTSAGAMERALAGQEQVVDPGAVLRRRWAWLAAATVAGAMVVAVVVVRSRVVPGDQRGAVSSAPRDDLVHSGPASQDAGERGGTPGSVAQPSPLAATATLHRDRAGQAVTLAPGDRVALGDGLYLELECDEAVYVYVMNEDEHGEAFVLFPTPGLDLPNPLAAHTLHRLPGTRGGRPFDWQVTSEGGSETVIVVASRAPIGALERGLRELPPASPDRPVTFGRLDTSGVDFLRGIGGMRQSAVAGRPGATRLAKVLSGSTRAGADAPRIWRFRLENEGN